MARLFDQEQEDELAALKADLEEDLQWIPSEFKINGHATTIMRFLLTNIDEMADSIPSSSSYAVFTGFHRQTIQSLPGQAQHYLQGIGLIGSYPHFTIQKSGLDTQRYSLYLENYLRSCEGTIVTSSSG